MEAIKKTIRIPKNHEITIKIPDHIPENQLAEVILLFKEDSSSDKIAELKEAVKDKLFISDLKEISEDFEIVDLENWE